jgi:Zn-dependent protease
MLQGILFTLVLFACVVMHEFGHALTARRFGIKTRDITLYPIGGVAKLERMPEKPSEEFWVTVAGPAVNFTICAFLFILLTLSGANLTAGSMSLSDGSFLQRLMYLNIWLGFFNLLPAFPMDGGRILRSLLAMYLNYNRATQLAARIGQGMAVLFGIAGLFMNPFLVVIAVFVWFGAGQEASMVQMKHSLAGIPASRAMLTTFQTLTPSDSLSRAVDLVLRTQQTDFPVVENDYLVGLITRSEIMQALRQHGQWVPVSSIMRRDIPIADANEMLERVLLRLQDCECQSMPVTSLGQLVGLLTPDSIRKFLMVQGVLSQNPRRGGIATGSI